MASDHEMATSRKAQLNHALALRCDERRYDPPICDHGCTSHEDCEHPAPGFRYRSYLNEG
jgi:hypothetical protein